MSGRLAVLRPREGDGQRLECSESTLVLRVAVLVSGHSLSGFPALRPQIKVRAEENFGAKWGSRSWLDYRGTFGIRFSN